MDFKYIVFCTENGRYLFDGVSCNIFSVNDTIYQHHTNLLNQLSNGSYKQDTQHQEQYEEILSMIKNGYFVENPTSPFTYWFDVDEYKNELQYQGMRHLMIGMTEKCNMRCKYCVYGGHYKNERIHGTHSISTSILFKAIDYFFSNSRCPEKVINFYGGEPFLTFPMIKEAVRYVQQRDPSATFYITTNGTLLNRTVAEWFASNKTIHLYISIAGTSEMHDQFRVFSDGAPTFPIIRDNLLMLKALDTQAYTERVHIVFNIFDELQLEELQEFYESDEIFKGLRNEPEITFIDCAENDGTVQTLYDTFMQKYSQNVSPIYRYIELLQQGIHDHLLVRHYDKKLLPIHRRIVNENKNTLSGVCRPFINKMFVDVDGNVHVCENFTFGNTFGTVNEHFKESMVDELLSRYMKYRSTSCKSCWAAKICSLCYRDLFDRSAQLDQERAKLLCNYERQQKQQTLVEYCTVMEAGVHLLDHLNDYVLFA